MSKIKKDRVANNLQYHKKNKRNLNLKRNTDHKESKKNKGEDLCHKVIKDPDPDKRKIKIKKTKKVKKNITDDIRYVYIFFIIKIHYFYN